MSVILKTFFVPYRFPTELLFLLFHNSFLQSAWRCAFVLFFFPLYIPLLLRLSKASPFVTISVEPCSPFYCVQETYSFTYKTPILRWVIWFGMNTLVSSLLRRPFVSPMPARFDCISWTFPPINLRRHLGWILGPNLPQILLGLHRRHFAWSRRYPVRHFLHSWFQTLRNHFLFTVFVKNKTFSWCYTFCCGYCQDSVLQIVAMTLGFFILALEWPLPLMKKLPIYRNLVVRIVILFS